MPLPAQTFNTITDLLNYINTKVIPNGQEEITGEIDNNVQNGLIKFIKAAVLNYDLIKLENAGGAIVLSRNVTLITTVLPASLTWGDNFQNAWIVANTLNAALPLLAGKIYFDAQGVPHTSIPAQSVIYLLKMSNGDWLNVMSAGAGGGGTVSGAADGTSLDGTTVKLGQIPGTLSDPAALTENREIPMAGNTLDFSGNGKVGINVNSPQARLHLGAATALLASLVIDAGTLVTAPIDGALEYDGSKLYFTFGAVRVPITTGAAAIPQVLSASYVSVADGTTSFVVKDDLNQPIIGAQVFFVIKEIKGLTNSQWSWADLTATLTLLGGVTLDDTQTAFVLYTKP